MRPWATTPLPSRNRSGRMPMYTTGMARAVSVTLKRTVSASLPRTTLPASTRPPTRNARSRGAFCSATSVGVRKNTMFERKAFNTRAVATPRPAMPATIHSARLVLGFKLSFLLDQAPCARAPRREQRDLQRERERRGAVRHPQIETVAHRSLTQRERRRRAVAAARILESVRERDEAEVEEEQDELGRHARIPRPVGAPGGPAPERAGPERHEREYGTGRRERARHHRAQARIEGEGGRRVARHHEVEEHRHPRGGNVDEDHAVDLALLRIGGRQLEARIEARDGEDCGEREEPGREPSGEAVEGGGRGEVEPVHVSRARSSPPGIRPREAPWRRR